MKMKLVKLTSGILCCLSLLMIDSYINAAAPTNVTEFIPQAMVVTNQAVAGNRRILAASTARANGVSTIYVTRYLLTGALDYAWNANSGYSNGIAVAGNFVAQSIAVDSLVAPGNIYVGGYVYDSASTRFLVVRYVYVTGALDTAGFNSPNGFVSTLISDGANGITVLPFATGVYLAGNAVFSGVPYGEIALYTTAGVLSATKQITEVTPFVVTCATIDGSNNILVGGYTMSGGTKRAQIIRYTSGLALSLVFTAFAGGNSSQWTSLAFDGTNILAGGIVDGQFTLARYLSATGLLDTAGFNSPNGFRTTAIGASDYVGQVISSAGVLGIGSTTRNEANNFVVQQLTAAGAVTFTTTTPYCDTSGLVGGGVDATGLIYGLGGQNDGLLFTRYTAAGALDTTFGMRGLLNDPSPGCATNLKAFIYTTNANNANVANTPVTIVFTNTPILLDFTPNTPLNPTTFTCLHTGSYLINWDGQFLKTNDTATNPFFAAQALVNGTSVPGSIGTTQAPDANHTPAASRSFVTNLNAGDILSFQWVCNTAGANNTLYSATPGGFANPAPGFSVSITRIN